MTVEEKADQWAFDNSKGHYGKEGFITGYNLAKSEIGIDQPFIDCMEEIKDKFASQTWPLFGSHQKVIIEDVMMAYEQMLYRLSELLPKPAKND
jgi:hypothetical protein